MAAEEKNSIVKKDEAYMKEMRAISNEFGGGAVDSLTSADVIMPVYKLIQNSSKKGTPGKWVSNIAPEDELEELNLIVLDMSSYRVLFPAQGQGDRPLCRSNNGISKSDVNGIGDGNCGTCRYAQWKKDQATGRDIKPKCSEGRTLLGIVLHPDGTRLPGMVSFKGAALRPTKQYLTAMRTKSVSLGIPSFAYVTNIASNLKVSEKGRYFIPEFEFGDNLDIETVREMALQVVSFRQHLNPDILIDDDYVSSTTQPEFDSFVVDSEVVEDDGNNSEIPF